MRVFIFDTETTGFPGKDDAHLVQFAAHICDLSFDKPLTVQEFSSLVASPVPVPDGAFDVHGISQEMSHKGLDPVMVCKWFAAAASKSDLIAAHNADFDMRMMRSEFDHYGIDLPDLPQVFCTMQATTELCELPGRYGKYKWPKLVEALKILCDHDLEGAHDALADVRGCRLLLLHLAEQGLVPEFKPAQGREEALI